MRKNILDISLCLTCFVGIIITFIDGRWLDTQNFWLVISIPSLIVWSGVVYLSWPNNASFHSWSPRLWRIFGAGFTVFIVISVVASVIVQSRENIDMWLIAGAMAAVISSSRVAIMSVSHALSKNIEKFPG